MKTAACDDKIATKGGSKQKIEDKNRLSKQAQVKLQSSEGAYQLSRFNNYSLKEKKVLRS